MRDRVQRLVLRRALPLREALRLHVLRRRRLPLRPHPILGRVLRVPPPRPVLRRVQRLRQRHRVLLRHVRRPFPYSFARVHPDQCR